MLPNTTDALCRSTPSIVLSKLPIIPPRQGENSVRKYPKYILKKYSPSLRLSYVIIRMCTVKV